MSFVFELFEGVGRFFRTWILFLISGKLLLQILMFLRDLVFLKFYKKQVPKVAFEFSFLSLSVIFLTAICTGAVLTLQTFAGLGDFASGESVARVVVPAVIRELGPVLAGLMIAGRISSSIAAQIATMKAMDQVNALKTLSIDPIKYLVLPRVFSGVILMPILMIVANVIAMFGSFVIITLKFNLSAQMYFHSLVEFFEIHDLSIGLLKSIGFGFIITIVGCFKGLNSNGNSEGVGIATTEAVVMSSVLILIINYALTLAFFSYV
jgi:phospholipid/cholesterol/gamma-HCH transport system permease protein